MSIDSIVIDNGSERIKAGFAGDDAPRAIFPTVVGRYKKPNETPTSEKSHFVGDEAMSKRADLILSHPIEHGLVLNFDWMEKIWHHTFYNELRVAPEDYPVMLTTIPYNPRSFREKTIQIMFESFNVPATCLVSSSVLSLLASGRKTGCVLESGDGITNAVPIYEGHVLPHAVLESPLAGSDITNYLIDLLSQRGYSFNTYLERYIVKDLKEKKCYVALDFDEEMQKDVPPELPREKLYDYSEENTIDIGRERFMCTEALFRPKLIAEDDYDRFRENLGIDEMVYRAINKCDPDLKDEMFSNIVLSGGNTMFEGISERMTKELKLKSPQTQIKVIAPPERKYMSFIGGSILADSTRDSFDDWISKDEYEEYGPSIVHRKCF